MYKNKSIELAQLAHRYYKPNGLTGDYSSEVAQAIEDALNEVANSVKASGRVSVVQTAETMQNCVGLKLDRIG